MYQTGVCRFCCCLLVWTISLKLESLGTSLRGCWVASNGIIFNTRKNPLWRSWQHCTAVLRCFFWETRISIKGQNNNVLYWFNVEDNSDSCLFFFLFLFLVLFSCRSFSLEHCFHIFPLWAQTWIKSHGKRSSCINFSFLLKASAHRIEAHHTSNCKCSGRLG